MSDITGGCLCGAVRFSAAKSRDAVTMCHCTQCRRTSGHYWASSHASLADFTLIKQDGLRWFASSEWAQRGFCDQCGSSLFYQMIGEDGIGIAAGTVDAPNTLKAAKHIFTDDQGDYYALTDALPKVGQY